MRKKSRKWIGFIVLMAVFTLLAGMSASAKTHKEMRGARYYKGDSYFVYSGPASGISKVKSSNKKVASVTTRKEGSDVEVYLKVKKPGTTNLSYKIKKKGKTVSYKIKLNFFKNPFKTLKVGKVNYKSQFNYSEYSTLCEGKGKVIIKLKKGWKVKSIKVQGGGSGWKKLKKGGQVDLEHKHSLRITLKNTKYGFTTDYWIWGNSV